MKFSPGKAMLVMAAAIAIFTALAHSSCIFLGPECYAFQMAPESIVTSAREGTAFAAIATLVVSAIFVIWAAYALSGAGLILRLPLLPLGIYTISFLCIVRGLLGIQLWIRKPEVMSTFGNVSSWIWFATGLLFLVGYRLVLKHQR